MMFPNQCSVQKLADQYQNTFRVALLEAILLWLAYPLSSQLITTMTSRAPGNDGTRHCHDEYRYHRHKV